MRLSEFLNFPDKFVENERNLFSDNESSDLINLYQSIKNDNLSRVQKIEKIKEILNICEISSGTERKKDYLFINVFGLKNNFWMFPSSGK